MITLVSTIFEKHEDKKFRYFYLKDIATCLNILGDVEKRKRLGDSLLILENIYIVLQSISGCVNVSL